MTITENTEKPNALAIEMTSAKCQEYVNRYRGFAKASAEKLHSAGEGRAGSREETP